MTIREVARRLEVSPAAIYRHFPDRDATLRANRSFDVSGDREPDPSALLESIVRSLALEPSFDRTQARSTSGAND